MGGLVPPGFTDRFSIPPVESGSPFSIDNAEKKAKAVLDRAAVKMEDFADLYGLENVQRDSSEAARLKALFEKRNSDREKESHKLAVVLEAVMHDQINNNQWFGPRVKALRTTDFDDVINGVDSVVEFKEPQSATSYLALGIDVTYRRDLESKFEKIRREIEKGELARIKYLKSSDGTFRGELLQVPRLIVAVDGESTHALAKAWYQNAPGLGANPLRLQLINEFSAQLEVFEKYALKVNQAFAVDKFANTRKIIARVKDEIETKLGARKHLSADHALSEMQKELLKIF